MTFKQGDIVFISGETGTGKSSFVKSLMGFVDANEIFFNGKITIFANESSPYTIWLSPFRCDTILVINI